MLNTSLYEKVAAAWSAYKGLPATPPVDSFQNLLDRAPVEDIHRHGYLQSLRKFHEIPHFNFDSHKKIADIILKRPELLNNPEVQKKLDRTIEMHMHWKDHYSLYNFANTLQTAITPALLNRCSSDTLMFVGKLREIYVTSAQSVLKDLQNLFSSDLKIVDGYRGNLPDPLQHRLKTIRKMIREVKTSYFGKYEVELQEKLEKTKAKWNRSVMPRLEEIKDFRREFRKEFGRTYGSKPSTPRALSPLIA